MQLKVIHLARLSLLSLMIAAILFLSGLTMCEDFKQKVMVAVKAEDDMAAMEMLYNRQTAGGKPDAFAYQVCAVLCARSGNTKAAVECGIKAIEMGE